MKIIRAKEDFFSRIVDNKYKIALYLEFKNKIIGRKWLIINQLKKELEQVKEREK